MSDLIEALQIFLKYGNPKYPTHCNHDELIVNINPTLVSEEDLDKLERLGFYPVSQDCFHSFRFGSC